MNKYLQAAAMTAALLLAAAGARAGELEVAQAWVRALPPGQPSTAAYMTITNNSTRAITLVGASAGIARQVQFHHSRTVDGMQRMEQLPQLALSPGQVLELAPGGTHLMLLGMERMPAPGESIPLCLQPAVGEPLCIAAPVRRGAGEQPAHAHHHH